MQTRTDMWVSLKMKKVARIIYSTTSIGAATTTNRTVLYILFFLQMH